MIIHLEVQWSLTNCAHVVSAPGTNATSDNDLGLMGLSTYVMLFMVVSSYIPVLIRRSSVLVPRPSCAAILDLTIGPSCLGSPERMTLV